MNLIEKVDNYIISNFFERIAWYSEARWGINNFHIARYLLVVYYGAYLAFAIATSRPYWLAATLFVIIAILFRTTYLQEARTKKQGFANHLRADLFQMIIRLVTLPGAITVLVSPLFSLNWLEGLVMFAYWLFSGFYVCNQMPPRYKERVQVRNEAYSPSS